MSYFTDSMLQQKDGQQHGDSRHHLTLPQHFHHSHKGKQRLLEFNHPLSGKRVHIVHTPEEFEKKNHEIRWTDPQNELFDVILHGSHEHIKLVEALHAEHTTVHEQLKEKHAETFQLFETVRSQLDILDAELHLLSDHSVALDASFDRFGYSAHLRTLDSSETSSLHESHPPSLSEHKERQADPIKFFRRPRIRQYFHKGLVWRSSHSSKVASFELFIDLVYVGVVDVIGQMAVDHPVGLSLLHFVIAFSIAAKIWCDMTMNINWFDVDDVFQRITFAYYLICLFGYTINISFMFEDHDGTYKSAIAFYLAQRLFLCIWYAVVAKLVPMIRGTMFTNIFTIFTTSALWIVSMHVSWAAQLTCIWLAIFLDLFGNILLVTLARHIKSCRGRLLHSLAKYFEFFPAINIEHRVERNDAFVTLVFGYSILTILYQSAASFGINAFFGKGVLGLIQAFALHWIYFEIDASEIDVHAIRRNWISATVWVVIHIPFVMSYVLSASTLSRIVLAHDCADADPAKLTSEYTARSIRHLSTGLRWFYCGGLGCSVICMAIISFSHTNRKPINTQIRKQLRLLLRCCVGTIIVCLAPAAGMNSLDLVATTSCLIVLLLIIDIYGNTVHDHSFWKGGLSHREKKKGVYTADIKISRRKRREIQHTMSRGDKPRLLDLFSRHISQGLNSATGSGSSTPTHVEDEEWQGGHY